MIRAANDLSVTVIDRIDRAALHSVQVGAAAWLGKAWGWRCTVKVPRPEKVGGFVSVRGRDFVLRALRESCELCGSGCVRFCWGTGVPGFPEVSSDRGTGPRRPGGYGESRGMGSER